MDFPKHLLVNVSRENRVHHIVYAKSKSCVITQEDIQQVKNSLLLLVSALHQAHKNTRDWMLTLVSVKSN